MIQLTFPRVRRERERPATIWPHMSDAAYYRAEAMRFLELAETAIEVATARRWQRLADDYVTLAEQLEADDTGRAPILTLPVQRQPLQQQQQQQSKKSG